MRLLDALWWLLFSSMAALSYAWFQVVPGERLRDTVSSSLLACFRSPTEPSSLNDFFFFFFFFLFLFVTVGRFPRLWRRFVLFTFTQRTNERL
jgi:hypothetical protein